MPRALLADQYVYCSSFVKQNSVVWNNEPDYQEITLADFNNSIQVNVRFDQPLAAKRENQALMCDFSKLPSPKDGVIGIIPHIGVEHKFYARNGKSPGFHITEALCREKLCFRLFGGGSVTSAKIVSEFSLVQRIENLSLSCTCSHIYPRNSKKAKNRHKDSSSLHFGRAISISSKSTPNVLRFSCFRCD